MPPFDIMGDDAYGNSLQGFDELLGDDDDFGEDDDLSLLMGYGGGGEDAGLGYEDDEIVGAGNPLAALARLSPRQRLALKRFAAARKRRVIARRGYTRERGLIMGFDRQVVGANLTVDFEANPQVPFRPRAMVVGATSIDGLVIEDIKVGKNSQFVTAGGVPAAMFGSAATYKDFKFDTATPGIDVVVTATDVSGAANTVAMSMNGVAAER